ncbi:hypothetical protein COX05_01455 [candidate division WWE3 bacterium CG22_combo_CG10-13_8_21_14_all_39_12]|nr:MAG: hypothetical protein COX05_01455 [candidate division WWE3 bacterium CG22_combo_CG10-13_8_21_14_all_39_12]
MHTYIISMMGRWGIYNGYLDFEKGRIFSLHPDAVTVYPGYSWLYIALGHDPILVCVANELEERFVPGRGNVRCFELKVVSSEST